MDVIINNPPASPVTAYPTYTQGYGPAYAPNAYGPPWAHGGPNPLAGLLFIVAAVLLARFALRRAAGRRRWNRHRWATAQGDPNAQDTPFKPRWPFWDTDGDDPAMRIARERFARGEINAEEFDTLRRTLFGQGNAGA